MRGGIYLVTLLFALWCCESEAAKVLTEVARISCSGGGLTIAQLNEVGAQWEGTSTLVVSIYDAETVSQVVDRKSSVAVVEGGNLTVVYKHRRPFQNPFTAKSKCLNLVRIQFKIMEIFRREYVVNVRGPKQIVRGPIKVLSPNYEIKRTPEVTLRSNHH